MHKLISIALTLFVLLTVTTLTRAEEAVTRDEIMKMCKAAAEMVLEDKSAAITEIGDKEGKFVWKDTYVFLMDMEGNMLAHPMIPQLTEKGSLLEVTDKNKDNPKKIFVEFVEIAKKNGDGWLWYKWPRPNSREPVDKFTYIHRVGNTDMFVGAGMYK